MLVINKPPCPGHFICQSIPIPSSGFPSRKFGCKSDKTLVNKGMLNFKVTYRRHSSSRHRPLSDSGPLTSSPVQEGVYGDPGAIRRLSAYIIPATKALCAPTSSMMPSSSLLPLGTSVPCESLSSSSSVWYRVLCTRPRERDLALEAGDKEWPMPLSLPTSETC
jgi:hypothetical protein